MMDGGMKNAEITWRNVGRKFMACLRDERGTAMAEYLILSGITIPLALYLFHPDNGLYQTARSQFDIINVLLQLPGP
jgi:hypothetical protein